MQNNRSRLMMAFGFTALFLLAFVGTTVVGGFAFGRVAGVVRTLRTVAQILGGLAVVGFLVSMARIAVAAALQPGSWPRKLLYVLPAYGLGFTLTGVILALLGIGTTGAFIVIWLAAGLLFSIVAVGIAMGRMKLSTPTLRVVLNALGITSLFSLLAWAAMVIAIVMVLINPPQAFAGGRNGEQNAQAGAATPAAAAPARQAQPGEQRGPGGRRSSTLPLTVGGAAMTLFLGLELWSVVRGRRGNQANGGEMSLPSSGLARADYGRETGRALLSCVAITIVAWGLGQLVPVSHSNPPGQTAIHWDSPQTQNLAKGACMDCHSDETVWPWYTYVAPGSWLTVSHVNGGRSELNFSELNNLPAFRKANLGNQVAEVIRSGEMPPKDYRLIHPLATLTATEKEQLIQGLQNIFEP